MLYRYCFEILLYNNAIRKDQEKQMGLQLNSIHHRLIYADVNLLRNNIDNTNKNTETQTDDSKEVDPEENREN
jgi:hypothetical protein